MRRVARSLSERCRIILRCADGIASKVVAAELGVHEHNVGKWRRRFLRDRIEGLLDEARPGRPRTIDDDQVAAVIERTLLSTPDDATHCSIRAMAAVTGFSHMTIAVSGPPSDCSHIASRRSIVCWPGQRGEEVQVLAVPFSDAIRSRTPSSVFDTVAVTIFSALSISEPLSVPASPC